MRTIGLLVAALLLAACGSPPSSEGPSAVDTMGDFVDAVDARDCEAMRALVLTPSDFDCSAVDAYASLFGDLEPGDAEVTQTSRSGSSAVVRVAWSGESADFEMERVDGSWKVLLDSAA